MFEFDLPDAKNIPTQSTSEPTALTQEEVAGVIRLAESYSLSRTNKVKLLLLVRNLKIKANIQSKHK